MALRRAGCLAHVEIDRRLEGDGDHRTGIIMGDKGLVKPTTCNIDTEGNGINRTKRGGRTGCQPGMWLPFQDLVFNPQLIAKLLLFQEVAIFVNDKIIRLICFSLKNLASLSLGK
jgi:hypothetical protein